MGNTGVCGFGVVLFVQSIIRRLEFWIYETMMMMDMGGMAVVLLFFLLSSSFFQEIIIFDP